MTPHVAPSSPAPPQRRAPAVERRRGRGDFRGSLERRLPATSLMAEAECLLPPVGRSEAFAEDLVDEPGPSGSSPSAPGTRGKPRLRWLGLPVLVLGVGATLSLVSVSGVAALVGF